ncbi:MAG: hypothetical protein QXK06_02470 [Candidatus Diapherotrites archaeon]
MNARAQLSVELLFTIMFLFIVTSIIFEISESFIERQAEIHLRNQETKIANSLSKIMVASKAFTGASGGTIEYQIPELYLLGNKAPMPCTISIETIGGNKFLKISAEYKGNTISRSIPYDGPNLPANTKCGAKITIS